MRWFAHLVYLLVGRMADYLGAVADSLVLALVVAWGSAKLLKPLGDRR